MLRSKLPHAVLSSFLSLCLVSQSVMAQTLTQSPTQMSSNLDSAEAIQNLLFQKNLIRAGSALIETDDLQKVYSFRSSLPVWIVGGRLTAHALALKSAMQKVALSHGLIFSDYWTAELESYVSTLATTSNSQAAVAFEMAASHSWIQLATHLSDGRMDPYSIDNDVRFKKRIFTDHLVVAQSVAGTPGMMADILETLAPQHRYYKDALEILAHLRKIKASGGFVALKKSATPIKLNQKSQLVVAIRERLTQYGYTLTGAGDIYDSELSTAVQAFQSEHGFEVSSELKADSGFWTIMNVGVDVRIAQTEANLEKLRWLPKQLEPNMIFVNTNSTEVKIWENNQVINQFRSINGRILRRTPMMKTWITRVIFNPKWTATDSIVLQDKLPEIKKNPRYLDAVNMKMFTRRGGSLVDPTTLDWNRNGHQIARNHVFVMGPGPKNALGTFKFPLVPDPTDPLRANSDDIFMHFTDDPSLFAKPLARHLSSGCIRLEKAQWLATYLLKNNPGYDENSIQNLIAKGTPGEIFQTDRSVMLNPSDYRAVYTVPLTVEKTKSGRARFMRDAYLHDRRIQNTVMAMSLRQQSAQDSNGIAGLNKENTAVTSVTTGLKVIGQAGNTQQFADVVAIRCDEPVFGRHERSKMRTMSRRCDAPVRFALNRNQTLAAGKYLVAFENSLFPGFVDVIENQITLIQLQKITVPKNLAQQRNIKVYRDLTSLVEQKKIYFEKFYFGKNIFRQTVRKFGDFYLAGSTDIDAAPQATFSYCAENPIDKLRLVTDIREHAKYVCESFNQAQTFMDYADLFRFGTNGTAQEAVADYPGDIIPKRHFRYLVATPMKATDFVSVMPGVYRLSADTSRSDARATTSGISENYGSTARVFANSENSGETDDIDLATTLETSETAPTTGLCSDATVWRTEKRSYCVNDNLDGCNRALAQQCTEMKLDLRFRK